MPPALRARSAALLGLTTSSVLVGLLLPEAVGDASLTSALAVVLAGIETAAVGTGAIVVVVAYWLAKPQNRSLWPASLSG